MAISQERMAQLQELATKVKSNPEMMNKIFGTQQVTPQSILQEIGNPAVSNTSYNAVVKEAIDRTSPEAQRKATEFQQKQQLGATGAGLFGNVTQAPLSSFREAPVARTPEGIETKFEEDPEIVMQREIRKQTEADKEKKGQEARSDYTAARLKMDNLFDTWLNMVDRTKQITGLNPGPLAGVTTKILGLTKGNEFVEGFQGGLAEYGAAIGAQAIPGARAVRLVNLFKGTAPSEFSTIASGIENTAHSFKNALAADIARNLEDYFPNLSNKVLTNDDYDLIRKYILDFDQQYRSGLYKLAYEKNPELIPPEKRIELMQGEQESANDTLVNEVLDRLGG